MNQHSPSCSSIFLTQPTLYNNNKWPFLLSRIIVTHAYQRREKKENARNIIKRQQRKNTILNTVIQKEKKKKFNRDYTYDRIAKYALICTFILLATFLRLILEPTTFRGFFISWLTLSSSCWAL